MVSKWFKKKKWDELGLTDGEKLNWKDLFRSKKLRKWDELGLTKNKFFNFDMHKDFELGGFDEKRKLKDGEREEFEDEKWDWKENTDPPFPP